MVKWWPETAAEFQRDIYMVCPLMPEGLSPHNETLPICRSLIRISSRPPYRVAQALAHELAHNRLNAILDVYNLFKPLGSAEMLYSPFRQTQRPVTAVLHGAFAFLNDGEMSMRLQGKVTECGLTTIERHATWCVERGNEAISILRKADVWTENGRSLINATGERLSKLAKELK
jgi:HEXXH motif-containing protein